MPHDPTTATPVGKLPLRDRIVEDLNATSEWARKQQEIEKRRHGMRPRQKKRPYRGAPNHIDPIIDDNVTEKTDQEVSMMMNAPRIAHAVPLGEMDPKDRALLEQAFDSYLRYVIRIRPRIEEAMDMKNSRGMAVIKNVRRYNEFLRQDVPDIEVIDPIRVIVPPDTIVGREERITHLMLMTPRELRDTAKKKSWSNVEEVIVMAKSRRDDGSTQTHDDIHKTLRQIIGIEEHAKQEFILVAEVYHYATDVDEENDRTGEIRDGRRMVTIFPFNFSELVLARFPWKEPDREVDIDPAELAEAQAQEMADALEAGREALALPVTETIKGTDKPWPFTTPRFEEKSKYWYASRGGGHKLMDDQIEATQLKNMRSVIRDYFMSPLLKSSGKAQGRNPTNVSYEPGSVLPQGMEWQVPPDVPADLIRGSNEIRFNAGRRMGSASQYNFSTQIGRTKVAKTATEISSEDARVATVSSASVDRFNDPLSRVFQLMFEDMARMEVIFPIIMPSQKAQEMKVELYTQRVLMIPAASSKTLNPEIQIRMGMQLVGFLRDVIEAGVGVDLQKAVEIALSFYDPKYASEVLFDPEDEGPQGQPPVYQVLAEIQEQIKALAEAGSGLNGKVTEVSKLAIENSEQIENAVKRKEGATRA